MPADDDRRVMADWLRQNPTPLRGAFEEWSARLDLLDLSHKELRLTEFLAGDDDELAMSSVVALRALGLEAGAEGFGPERVFYVVGSDGIRRQFASPDLLSMPWDASFED